MFGDLVQKLAREKFGEFPSSEIAATSFEDGSGLNIINEARLLYSFAWQVTGKLSGFSLYGDEN